MHRYARYALATLVALALLSTAVHAAVLRTPFEGDPSVCGRAEISAYPAPANRSFGDPVVRDYGALSERERRAIDRARAQTNRTAAVDPALVGDLPDAVVVNGTRYRVTEQPSHCPLIGGTPRWLNSVLAPFLAFYGVFSPLFLPGGRPSGGSPRVPASRRLAPVRLRVACPRTPAKVG